MEHALDDTLIYAYKIALRLNVDQHFIVLLKKELISRNLLDQIEEANSY
ncbi:sporulation histidine kinase inhibitor Sda [Lentibacillus cibarius]|uniref:Sporulation histidine kinase inhibitor Sda n=1 Tax=Lentibacillus cibarius TaxID=2583219 RepID=A0A5S3QLK6_9BACI|nr:sporulation histidine kinase inhibitor Sda [Lentibacillus cibarius]TMN22675.1 sporulation histidine kinase inhibitor Sda [Lentibacillus cibarius]